MATRTGGCHCGAIRYDVSGEPLRHSLCHCQDCRRHAGAPLVAWAIFRRDAVRVTKGEPKLYQSSKHGRRLFCPDCGAGIFYTNDEIMPGFIDVQSATLDDPDALAPQAQVQIAERLKWMEHAHKLPAFCRFPPEA